MKFFSKISRFFLISLVPAALLLSACNTPEPVPTATSTPEQTATPIPPTRTPTPTPTATATPLPEYLDIKPEELEGTKLMLRFSLYGEAKTVLEELVQRFSEENSYGITVQTIAESSMDELGKEIRQENNISDLIIANTAWLRSLSADGIQMMDLSEFLNTPGLAFDAENTSNLMPVMMETEEQDGSIYALPLWAEPAFLFYNKTWGIELGYSDSPTDLASFAMQACEAGKANYSEKDYGKHGTGGWIISSAPEDVMSWLLVFAKNNESPVAMLQDEEGNAFQEMAAWLRNLYDNGCAWTSRLTEPYDYFADRYALFYSGTYSDAERQLNAFAQSDEHPYDNWDLLVYPVRSADSDPRIYGDVVSIAIPEGLTAKETNAAWQFIRWLYSETNAAELALAANGWPVQDSEPITKLYRGSGKDKLYQTLSYRQYLVNPEADANWLTDQRILSDGFAYVFNPSAKPEDIPEIWGQIGGLIAEINSVNNLPETIISEESNQKGVNDETL